MRRPQGYATITDPDLALVELDTFTCAHCNKITHVKPHERAEDLGGLCKLCMGLICSSCVATGICDPFENKLRREEEHYHTLKSYGLIG